MKFSEKIELLTHSLSADWEFFWLCSSAFWKELAMNFFWIAMPFVLKALGGSDFTVGLCLAANMGFYLIACVVMRPFIDRINPKIAIFSSVSIITLLLFALLAVLLWPSPQSFLLNPINFSVIVSAAMGICFCFFSPAEMGWISAGHAGVALTKRLSLFNVSWSLGAIVGLFIGGFLLEVNRAWTIAAAGISGLFCLFSVFFASRGGKVIVTHTEPLTEEEQNAHKTSGIKEIWILSVLLLVLSSACIGIFRSQLPLLFKFELGFSESQYGIVVTIMAITTTVMFAFLGRVHGWHYKRSYILLAQVSLMVSMGVVIAAKTFWIFVLPTILVGLTAGFSYKSHQYYIASLSHKKSAAMAFHEIILSAGLSGGFILGGLLSDAIGRYSPYWLCLILAAITALILPVLRALQVRFR